MPHHKSLKSNYLLLVYAIIPAVLLVVLADISLFQSQLQNILPASPESLLIWHLIFVYPHIFASVLTLADKQYIQHYQKRFITALFYIVILVLAFTSLLPLLLNENNRQISWLIFFIFIAFATMYHVLSQQLGMSMSLMGLKAQGKDYETWRWLNALAGTLLYLSLFIKPILLSYQLLDTAINAALILWIASAIQGVRLISRSRHKIGQLYAASNIIMLGVVYVLIQLDYGFFAIVIPRVVHDITAFMVYSVHDHNRNSNTKHNYIYKLKFLKGISPLLLCFPIAAIVSQLIQCTSFYLDSQLGFQPLSACFVSYFYQPSAEVTKPINTMQIWLQISLIVAFFHYYIEAIIWKKDAPHRKGVTLKI